MSVVSGAATHYWGGSAKLGFCFRGSTIMGNKERVASSSAKMDGKENRKCYEKPAVIHREPLEIVAASCSGGSPLKGANPCTVLSS